MGDLAVEQGDGALLGVEQLPGAPRGVTQELVDVAEACDASREFLERLAGAHRRHASSHLLHAARRGPGYACCEAGSLAEQLRLKAARARKSATMPAMTTASATRIASTANIETGPSSSPTVAPHWIVGPGITAPVGIIARPLLRAYKASAVPVTGARARRGHRGGDVLD